MISVRWSIKTVWVISTWYVSVKSSTWAREAEFATASITPQIQQKHMYFRFGLNREKTGLCRSTQKFVRDFVKPGKLGLLAAPEGRGGALTMHADALLYMGILFGNQEIWAFVGGEETCVWVQIASGELLLNGNKLQVGDGAAVSEESVLKNTWHQVQWVSTLWIELERKGN